MTGSGHGHTASPSVTVTALDALLAAEHDAGLRLERARAEAAAIVAAARSDAGELSRRAAARQVAEVARAEAEHALTIAEIERSVAQSAEDTLARYHGLPPEVLRNVAATILAELTGLSARDAP